MQHDAVVADQSGMSSGAATQVGEGYGDGMGAAEAVIVAGGSALVSTVLAMAPRDGVSSLTPFRQSRKRASGRG